MFRKRKFLGIINFQGHQWQMTYSIFLLFLSCIFPPSSKLNQKPPFLRSKLHLHSVHSFQWNYLGEEKLQVMTACGIVSMSWMQYMNIGQLCLLYCFSPCVLDMSLWLSRVCTLDSISTELSLHSRWLVNEQQRFYASSVNCAQYRIWAVCPSEWPF